MNKKWVILSVVLIALAGAGFFLYYTNQTPVVAELTAAQVANSNKPLVIKLHAQWCPVCRMTKPTWSRIETEFHDRANLVVFDFTNDATTALSRDRADRLGIREFFDESDGITGTIVVLDGRTKEVRAWLGGKKEFDEYAAAIKDALVVAPETR